MDPRTFDNLTRRAAALLTRRSVLGLLSGTVLVARFSPRPTIAKKGGKGGKKKGQATCRKQALVCQGAVHTFCDDTYFLDPGDAPLYELCMLTFLPCCLHYRRCKEAEGDACLSGTPPPSLPPPVVPPPPPCCPNATDICCPAGSVISCCPDAFPICNPNVAGIPACCPAHFPIPCANHSNTCIPPSGYHCCPLGGACRTDQICCPNGCCPNTTVCDETGDFCIIVPPERLSAASRSAVAPFFGGNGAAG